MVALRHSTTKPYHGHAEDDRHENDDQMQKAEARRDGFDEVVLDEII